MTNINQPLEIWKDIAGYEGYYQVSSYGRVKSLERIVFICGKYPFLKKEKILTINKNGYRSVCFAVNGLKKHFILHRIVAEVFIPNPENKPEVNHVNGIKWDNRVENLEWCTAKENIHHAISIGKIDMLGSKNKMSKLTEKDISEIRTIGGNLKQNEIADIYKVDRRTISKILNNQRWSHL